MHFGIVRPLVCHTFGGQETPVSNSMLSLSRFKTKRNGWGSPFFVQGRARLSIVRQLGAVEK